MVGVGDGLEEGQLDIGQGAGVVARLVVKEIPLSQPSGGQVGPHRRQQGVPVGLV